MAWVRLTMLTLTRRSVSQADSWIEGGSRSAFVIVGIMVGDYDAVSSIRPRKEGQSAIVTRAGA